MMRMLSVPEKGNAVQGKGNAVQGKGRELLVPGMAERSPHAS